MESQEMWTIIGSSTAVVVLIYTFLRNFKTDLEAKMGTLKTDLEAKMGTLKTDLEAKMGNLETKIDRLDEKVTDIDRRLCRLEGAFTAKECCRIQDERHLRKAE